MISICREQKALHGCCQSNSKSKTMIAIVMSITIRNHSFLKKFTMLSRKRFMGGNIYGLLDHNNRALLITGCKLTFYLGVFGIKFS